MNSYYLVLFASGLGIVLCIFTLGILYAHMDEHGNWKKDSREYLQGKESSEEPNSKKKKPVEQKKSK
jgi:hypothetical protein